MIFDLLSYDMPDADKSFRKQGRLNLTSLRTSLVFNNLLRVIIHDGTRLSRG